VSTVAPESPTGSFAEHLEQSTESAAVSGGPSQKAELFVNGASIGWLGETDGEWCVVAGRDSALALEAYVYSSVLYYRKASATSRYLSVSDGYNYVGFYNWYGARGWTYKDGVLTSLYTNASLSIWSSDNAYVYANGGSGYTPVTVAFH